MVCRKHHQDVVSAEGALITLETVPSSTRSAIEDTTTVEVGTFAKFVKERLDTIK
jgi:hypothetical protein